MIEKRAIYAIFCDLFHKTGSVLMLQQERINIIMAGKQGNKRDNPVIWNVRLAGIKQLNFRRIMLLMSSLNVVLHKIK